jgi:hypothetical protein
MIVHVTHEQIERGDEWDRTGPIALALREEHGWNIAWAVYPYVAEYDPQSHNLKRFGHMPTWVQEWLQRKELGISVEPIEFEVLPIYEAVY